MPDRYVLREHGGYSINPAESRGTKRRPDVEVLVMDSLYGYAVVWSSGEVSPAHRVPAARLEGRQMCDDLNAWAALQ